MQKSLSVLILADIHPIKFGSYEEMILSLAKKLIEQGHRCVLVFSSQPTGSITKNFLETGAKLTILNFGHSLFTDTETHRVNLLSAWQLYKIIRKHQINLVHIHFLALSHPAMLGVYLYPGVKIFYTDHISGEVPKRSFLKQQLYQLYISYLNWRITRFIGVSNYVRNRMISDQKFNPKKTITIYNGVNPDRFTGLDGKQFRKELNIVPTTKVITSVAMLLPEKGIQYLIRALPRTISSFPNIILLIVGVGYYESELRRISQELNVESYIRFLGLRNNVERIFAGSDLVIVPSVWQEAFGLSIVEAMISQKPVIATKVGGIPELLEHMKTGFLIEANSSEAISSAILSIFENNLDKEIGLNAAAYAKEQFSIDRNVNNTISDYTKLN
jgi:L-malate glycosyltransferase